MEVWTVQTAALRTGLVLEKNVQVYYQNYVFSLSLSLSIVKFHHKYITGANKYNQKFHTSEWLFALECSELEQRANVIWTCSNDSENINCTIACADGYDFDHEIKPNYYCGIDTFYLWDFQTDDNPGGKMPTCQS